MKEKAKSELTRLETLKYIIIVKYYEYIFPIFSDELGKERMQVLAFMIKVKDTKHWKKYQRALKTLKFGYRQPLDGATVIKNVDGSITTITKGTNGITTEITTQESILPVPEVQVAIEVLDFEKTLNV
jgi:hypothetical protein